MILLYEVKSENKLYDLIILTYIISYIRSSDGLNLFFRPKFESWKRIENNNGKFLELRMLGSKTENH